MGSRPLGASDGLCEAALPAPVLGSCSRGGAAGSCAGHASLSRPCWIPAQRPPAGLAEAASSRRFVAGCKFFGATLLSFWVTIVLEHVTPILQLHLPIW